MGLKAIVGIEINLECSFVGGGGVHLPFFHSFVETLAEIDECKVARIVRALSGGCWIGFSMFFLCV